MLGSIFLAMSLDFATLTSVKKVRNLQHESLPIEDINFPTKNYESPDFGSRMYHMYASTKGCKSVTNLRNLTFYNPNLDIINVNVYTKFG